MTSATNDVQVTVVVPTFEQPIFLARALTCIRDQSHRWLEVVVVNNGGDPTVVDELVEVVAKSSSPHAQSFRIIHIDTKETPGAAINRALAETTGDFVAILDESATWKPDFVSVASAALLQNSDAVAVTTGYSITYEKKIDDRLWPRRNESPHIDVHEMSLANLLAGNEVPLNAVMYRRSMLNKVGLFNATLDHLYAWDLDIRLASNGDFFVTPEQVSVQHVLEQSPEEQMVTHDSRDRERDHLISQWLSEELPGGANKGEVALHALANRNRNQELESLRAENNQLRKEIANFNAISSRMLRGIMQPSKIIRAARRKLGR